MEKYSFLVAYSHIPNKVQKSVIKRASEHALFLYIETTTFKWDKKGNPKSSKTVSVYNTLMIPER